MKTPGRVFTLDDEDYENESSFSHWTISSSLSDHKLVYRLNQVLGSNFKRSKSDHVSHLKGHHFEHVAYTWYDSFEDIQWCILMNRGRTRSDENQTEVLHRSILASKPPVDYIVVAMDEIDSEQANKMLTAIRKTQGVTYATALEPSVSQRAELNIELENILL